MKILFACYSLQPQTGIGRLVGSIIDQARKEIPELEILVLTSEGLLSISSKVNLICNLPKIFWAIKSSDFVHVFDIYPYGFLITVLAKIARRPILLTLVGTGSVKNSSRFPLSLIFKFTLWQADQITAISSYIRGRLYPSLTKREITVINPGIDYSFWSQPSDDEDNPFDFGGEFLLSVGSFKKRKGYEESLEAFRLLLEKQPRLRYVIVSGLNPRGSFYDKIKSLIDNYHLTDRVIIIGDISDRQLRAVYQRAKLFMLLSRNDGDDVEGFGLVFLEAAAAGVPVIGTINSGASDALRVGYNGYCFDPKDIVGVVDKSNQIIGDDKVWQNLSDNSRVFAKAQDWPKAAEPYLEIYQKLGK